ncbi:hypothetical protein HXA34_20505 [Salipaludibacillus agaradhaerens]|uniref:hypothetical protein n=1 Tax=Salipaludibacillus agaradhaerens TaxID=76935 RepID=UPI0021519EF6|nr:hypothetical protein [Salipaludibacillus agaradhaerens]MCR6108681.1 hypothetical protein [Salipaludibacillus agaradhaerens]MCR6120704.1 hypothetical protein [Salipaludibacillus agaradhaerens]
MAFDIIEEPHNEIEEEIKGRSVDQLLALYKREEAAYDKHLKSVIDGTSSAGDGVSEKYNPSQSIERLNILSHAIVRGLLRDKDSNDIDIVE